MNGRCAICDTIGKLTNDHVPPKSVSTPTRIEISRLIAVTQTDDPTIRRRGGFQSAIFPSLCRTCNTERLGTKYDPTLKKIAEDVRRWVRVMKELDISVTGDIQVTTSPQRLARAVAGHLLAAEERKEPSHLPQRGTMTEALRAFFLDEKAPWPDELHLYVLLFPDTRQVIVRGLGIMKVLGQTYGPIVGELLKFFPLAFWITSTPAVGVTYRLTELRLHKSPADLDAQITLSIALRGMPPPRWPELPSDGGVVMLTGERTYVATPRENKTR